jgi:hypothetical protein
MPRPIPHPAPPLRPGPRRLGIRLPEAWLADHEGAAWGCLEALAAAGHPAAGAAAGVARRVAAVHTAQGYAPRRAWAALAGGLEEGGGSGGGGGASASRRGSGGQRR